MATIPILAAAGAPPIVAFLLAEAAGSEPWWIAVLVVPLAGFSAWLVRWILQKQDLREADIATREKTREEREEKRAEQAVLQTRALQECVTELRRLNEQQEEHGKALAAIPDRTAAVLHQRKAV